MADAYGAIVVGFSDDFKGDKSELARVLSELSLSNSGAEFVVNNDLIWCSESQFSGPQYPSLTPMRDKIICLMIDNVEVHKHVSEVTEDEMNDSFWDVVEDEEIPLSDLAAALAEFIDTGALHVSCCSNEKQRSVDSECMTINADGSATRVSISHWVGKAPVISEEKC